MNKKKKETDGCKNPKKKVRKGIKQKEGKVEENNIIKNEIE